MKSALGVDVLSEEARWETALGDLETFAARALEAAAAHERKFGSVSVLFTHDAAMQALNRQFRGKDAPTNVLAFASLADHDGFWGDLALGYQTCAAESEAAGRPLAAHAAHLLVHGYLHLLGYDHDTEEAAAAMEARERLILAGLGVADPYADAP
jgi:probable rRNA maturation factor